jgi:hypothetical protein
MSSNFTKYKSVFLLFLLFGTLHTFSQNETSQWKMHLGFGFNNPLDDIKEDEFFAKNVNFPSINLGINYMFNREIGAKLDFSYNRVVHADESAEFKFNYARINAQLVYDFTYLMSFLPRQMAMLGHVGPGISFTKPLGNFIENKYTFLNAAGGLEIHYGIARTVSVFTDFSYVLNLSGKDKYDPEVDGFSFNGDLMALTFGISVSLSGCFYCE